MPAVLPAPEGSAGPDHEAPLEPVAADGAEAAAPVAEVPVAEVSPVPVAEVSQVSRRYVLEPAGGDSREVLAAVLGAGPGRVIAA